MGGVPVSARALASPRLRGEVDALGSALARPSAAGEGDSPRVECVDRAPHPDLLPARAGRRRRETRQFHAIIQPRADELCLVIQMGTTANVPSGRPVVGGRESDQLH